MVCYQGESPALTYSYSGITLTPEPFSAAVLRVRDKVQALFPSAPLYNTVLMNKYDTGAHPARRCPPSLLP